MSYLLQPTPRLAQPANAFPLEFKSTLSTGLLGMWVPNGSITTVPEAIVGNNMTVTPDVAGTNAWGEFGRGVKFTATDVAGNISTTANDARQSVTTGAISVAALLVPLDATTRCDVFTRWQNGSTAGDQFDLLYSLSNNAKMQFFVSSGAATGNSGAASQALTPGVPYVVGGSAINGGNIIVYTNGVVGNSAAIGLTLQASPTAAYRILSNGANGGFLGACFGAFVWNRVLSANEWLKLSALRNAPWQVVSQSA